MSKKGKNFPLISENQDLGLDLNSSINKNSRLAERLNMGAEKIDSISFDISKIEKDMGKPDSFRFKILNLVANEDYDSAIKGLKTFHEQEAHYPNLKERTERYIGYSVDLVNAIKAKRHFPGMKMLTMAKQKDLNDKFLSHFYELQQTLKRIENIQRDIKLDDAKSTIWVVKAIAIAVLVVVVASFLRDVNDWLLKTTLIVVDDTFERLTHWLFTFF